MKSSFPSIGEYNQLIQRKGGLAFSSLTGLTFIPSKTTPIKVFLFGSGAYAVVFKATDYNNVFAIRCFLSAENETLNRYKSICAYLKNCQSKWKLDCEFLENELEFKNTLFPILKMEWMNGILINQFISNNLTNNLFLTNLQIQLVEISNDLEDKKIGHGDIQCGNIIVIGDSSNFQIKLIDYDGMFIPEFSNLKSIEKGRSEFQHPRRSVNDFNCEIDRFSFWVILTAIEAIKFDKNLWLEVMQGGFNTLDNFLFTMQDFLNPNNSLLFNRLYKLNSSTLNFYLDNLKFFCLGNISSVIKPEIFSQTSEIRNLIIPSEHLKYIPNLTIQEIAVKSGGNYKIQSNIENVTVLTSSFKKLGITPLELEKNEFEGKTILITNGIETKRITLNSQQIELNILF